MKQIQGDKTMQKTVIEEIYYNLNRISEKVNATKSYNKMSQKTFELYQKLSNMLNDEQKDIFERYIEAGVDLSVERELSTFKNGLQFALLLVIECLN